MKFKMLSVFFVVMLSACESVVWHEGSTIQYKEIKDLGNREYSIEILGGWKHDQPILENAVLKKAKSMCGGDAKILSSKMETYYAAGAGGGVGISGNPPKITSIVKCTGTRS